MATVENTKAPTPARFGQQDQKHVGSDVSPKNCCQCEIGICAQRKHLDGIAIPTSSLNLQTQPADAKKCQVQSRKYAGLHNAERDTDPESNICKWRMNHKMPIRVKR